MKTFIFQGRFEKHHVHEITYGTDKLDFETKLGKYY